MFALRVSYLMGRVYSARFEQGDLKEDPEWPPHPSRLFSALVSAWADGGGEPNYRIGLEWLEQQAPPTIWAGEASVRRTVQAYVPVNDVSTLPENRARKGRTFPSASLTNPDVYFVWDDDAPEEVQRALEAITERTSYLGHSASMVAAYIVDQLPLNGLKRWRPSPDRGKPLRVAYEGRLAELNQAYKRFQASGNKVHRPSAGRSVGYTQDEVNEQKGHRSVFDTIAVIKRINGPRVTLTSTLALTAALRGVLLKLAPQPVPEFLSGHAEGSTPESPIRSERPHVALVPLAFTAGRHATGDILGLGMLLPDTLTQEERKLFWSLLGRVNQLTTAFGVWTVAPGDSEDRTNLLPQTWIRDSTVWSTVTPLVLDRYPKEPYGEEAHTTVREAFRRVGLPEPVELDLHYNPWHIGVPKASHFPAAQARNGKPQRFHCHVRARFERAIQGPVVAGAGRFYGYGLFRQHWEGA